MALTYTQNYKDYLSEQNIHNAEARLKKVKDRLIIHKSELEVIYAAVNADANASAELKALASQANSFVNNIKYTEFITFVGNNLD